jgi:kynurenine 3-monooxygenase
LDFRPSGSQHYSFEFYKVHQPGSIGKGYQLDAQCQQTKPSGSRPGRYHPNAWTNDPRREQWRIDRRISTVRHQRPSTSSLTTNQASANHPQFIRAVDRGGLNKLLLNELESLPNVKLFFNHKLAGADFRRNKAWFEVRGSGVDNRDPAEIEVAFDFMIGADGAHSAVRYHLMKFARMSYQQSYIDTLWCEFHIAPRREEASAVDETPGGDDAEKWTLHPNRLHIWPGGRFMFIAIPSLDRSFTSTLFLGEKTFNELDADPGRIVPFFKENFPGVVPDLISEEDVVKQYQENPHLPLVSIKCSPYHFGSSAVILGDAAHAMVPFYGQGMNAGLEDVRVLFDHLDKYLPPTQDKSKAQRAVLRAAALQSYTKDREQDASAICDMAYANYAEMSSHVRSPLYLLRKFVEERLSVYLPSLGWATQYSRVSFGNERYSVVQSSAKRQQKVLREFVGTLVGGAVGLGIFWAVRLRKRGFS